MHAAPSFDGVETLPRPLTSIVGRERETAAVLGLLQRPAVRLVSLTGPGGVGKTRLAIHVAERAASFADGVVFVSLGPIGDPALVLPAIAHALGLREAPDLPQLQQVGDALALGRILLILDNLEQVTAAAPLILDLLAAAPDLTVLATSRTTLRLTGEFEYAVPPLAVSEKIRVRSEETNRSAYSPRPTPHSDAVQLFLQRARAVRPDFALTDENAAIVAEICARLDGLPLAIELAAARVKVLSSQALLARLSHRLGVLTGGARDLPARLQTMRDAVAWSHDLLDDDEQVLFRRIAVFAGGFTIEGADRVAADGSGVTLDLLQSLIEKSLVRVEDEESDEPRFGMLGTIREFALERLEASGEAGAIRERHAAYVLTLAEAAWVAYANPAEQKNWLDRLETEHDNLQAALGWYAAADPVALLRLSGALYWYWYGRGRRREGREWLERVLAMPEAASAPAALRARALLAAGVLAHFRGEDERALPWLNEALAAWQESGEAWGVGYTQLALGVVDEDAGRYDEAEPRLVEALECLQAAGAEATVVTVRYHLGVVAYGRGDLVEAERYLAEALSGPRERRGGAAAYALQLRGLIAAEGGEATRAAELLGESLEIFRDFGLPEGVSDALAGFAVLAARVGQSERAVRLFAAVEAMDEVSGARFGLPERVTYERVVVKLRTAVGEAYEAIHAAGRALSVEAAIAEAEAVTDEATTPPARQAEATRPERIAADRFGLTAREFEILGLLAEGRSNKEIADALFISPRTAGTHVANLCGKLGVHNRSAAAARAYQLGLA